MTVLAAVCTKMPEAKLAIIFLPVFTFTAGNVSGFEYLKEFLCSLATYQSPVHASLFSVFQSSIYF